MLRITWLVIPILASLLPSTLAQQVSGNPPLQPIHDLGAGPSASDLVTPLPEGGSVANNAYTNKYFGLSYPIPTGWTEGYKGPPPSDKGYYVLVSLKYPSKATILIAARDMFFTPAPANNAMEMIQYDKETLSPDYDAERPPTEIEIAGRSFGRFDYTSKVAGLHWYIVATEIRCNVVEIILTGRDTRTLENVIQEMNKMLLPAEAGATSGTGGGDSPACIKGYATEENVIHMVEPVLTGRRFNAIPVRVIIDKNGSVKHVHVISSFPEQAKIITNALLQWKFKPYLRNGQPVEVETGIMFGRPVLQTRPSGKPATKGAN